MTNKSLYAQIEENASELFADVHEAIAKHKHVAKHDLLVWLFPSFEQDMREFESEPQYLSYSDTIEISDLDDDNHSYECYAGDGYKIVVDTRLLLSIALEVIPEDGVYLTTRPIIEDAGGTMGVYDCMYYDGDCLEIEDVPRSERSSHYIDEDNFDDITFEREKLYDFSK